jgi:alpha-beta hydrolase superfamily lysophospholipase
MDPLGRGTMSPEEKPQVQTWRFAAHGWRFSNRLTPRSINLYLRLRSGRRLPRAFRARFAAMKLPPDTIDQALGDVHGLGDWMAAWNRVAQRHLSEARREETDGRWQESAEDRRNAAMCYHTAHLITDTDQRTLRALRSSAATVFSQAIPRLMADTRKVSVRWRTAQLPGYLAKPAEIPMRGAPVVVMLNGATTSKEELLLWADPFLQRGLAVLTLDWPGTGEAFDAGRITSRCDDFTDGLFNLLEQELDLNSERVALLGFSLGAAVAVRAAASDRRIDACVAVTGPYDPRRWIRSVNPIVRHQLEGMAGAEVPVREFANDFSLVDITRRLRCPLLVLGAGRDLIVPPEESLHLCAAVGELGTLIWYPNGTHGLYEHIDDWTQVTAIWLRSMLAPELGIAAVDSTRVEDQHPGLGTVEGVYVDDREDRENLVTEVGETAAGPKGEELEPSHRPPREDPAFIGGTPVPPVPPLEDAEAPSASEGKGTEEENPPVLIDEPQRQES